jgi:hypothetical protein
MATLSTREPDSGIATATVDKSVDNRGRGETTIVDSISS